MENCPHAPTQGGPYYSPITDHSPLADPLATTATKVPRSTKVGNAATKVPRSEASAARSPWLIAIAGADDPWECQCGCREYEPNSTGTWRKCASCGYQTRADMGLVASRRQL